MYDEASTETCLVLLNQQMHMYISNNVALQISLINTLFVTLVKPLLPYSLAEETVKIKSRFDEIQTLNTVELKLAANLLPWLQNSKRSSSCLPPVHQSHSSSE